jgi:HAD superfamily hydrolase (TIGR01509 family)
MSAILFGSISTLADTSELQRAAFNEAFSTHGLDWTWPQEEYAARLDSNGGSDRVAAYAEARGESVDAAAVHQTKSEIFQRRLASEAVTPRPGVVDTIRAAADAGVKVALVTTTSPENVVSLLEALRRSPDGADVASFDLVVDSTQVEAPKPDQAAYVFALDRLGESAADCVAIEDNVGGVASATAAGIGCVAFPNANTGGHDFGQAASRVDALDFATLRPSGS